MKKYFIGILALVLAVGFSAFTKPTTGELFRFLGSATDAQDQNKVKDVVNFWERETSASCSIDVQQMPCTIEVTDPKFYHTDGGDIVLNDEDYALSHSGEEEAVLTTTAYPSGGTTTYYIVTSSVVTDIANKARP